MEKVKVILDIIIILMDIAIIWLILRHQKKGEN